jgi:hypothetical protein
MVRAPARYSPSVKRTRTSKPTIEEDVVVVSTQAPRLQRVGNHRSLPPALSGRATARPPHLSDKTAHATKRSASTQTTEELSRPADASTNQPEEVPNGLSTNQPAELSEELPTNQPGEMPKGLSTNQPAVLPAKLPSYEVASLQADIIKLKECLSHELAQTKDADARAAAFKSQRDDAIHLKNDKIAELMSAREKLEQKQDEVTASNVRLLQTEGLLTASRRALKSCRAELEAANAELQHFKQASGAGATIMGCPGYTLYVSPNSDRYASAGWPPYHWTPAFFVTCQPAAEPLVVPASELNVTLQPAPAIIPPLPPRDVIWGPSQKNAK